MAISPLLMPRTEHARRVTASTGAYPGTSAGASDPATTRRQLVARVTVKRPSSPSWPTINDLLQTRAFERRRWCRRRQRRPTWRARTPKLVGPLETLTPLRRGQVYPAGAPQNGVAVAPNGARAPWYRGAGEQGPRRLPQGPTKTAGAATYSEG